MRPEKNPLDLNNFPEDFTRSDGKQVFEEGSSSGCRKKKSGDKDESGKVYECRFCSLKFCKSQALGGHMNRHRQERETETLNRARQLVFSNDNLAAPGAPHLGCHPITAGSYHPTGNLGDPTLPFRSVYPSRLFSASSSSSLLPPPPPPHQPYLYPSPSRLSSYPPHPINDYYVGHVLSHQNLNYNNMPTTQDHSNYTCIGAPVGHEFGSSGSTRPVLDLGAPDGGRDGSLNHQQRLDPPSINRFQDHGF